MLHDYYGLLGVSPDTSEEELDAAYRRLAEAYGRQRDPASEEALRRITRAYEVLSDPVHRAGYDQARRLGVASPRLGFNLRQSLPWLTILAAALVLFLWSPWGRSLREGPTAVPSPSDAGQVTPPRATLQPSATITPTAPPATPTPRPTPTVLASREQCLAALHQDALAAMDANCSSVLQLSELRETLDMIATDHLESLFAELESYGVSVQSHSEVAQAMDAWLAATEALHSADSPAAARAAYQRILAEERKLTALRDALRLQQQ